MTGCVINRFLEDEENLAARIDRSGIYEPLREPVRGACELLGLDPLLVANEGKVVVFPREWLRDPQSRYLSEFPVDIPWDDPELMDAMLAMRKGVNS